METKARRRQGGARGSAPRGSAPPGLPGRGNSYQAPWFSGAGQCGRTELAPASELARAGGSRAATRSSGGPGLRWPPWAQRRQGPRRRGPEAVPGLSPDCAAPEPGAEGAEPWLKVTPPRESELRAERGGQTRPRPVRRPVPPQSRRVCPSRSPPARKPSGSCAAPQALRFWAPLGLSLGGARFRGLWRDGGGVRGGGPAPGAQLRAQLRAPRCGCDRCDALGRCGSGPVRGLTPWRPLTWH